MKAKRNKSAEERKRILVAIDFSQSSLNALRRAVEFAASYDAALVLLHVVPADYGLLGLGRDKFREYDEALQCQAAVYLREIAAKISSGRNEADLQVRIGKPADEIIAAARDENCNLIVLGMHGETALHRLIVGSVADRVIRTAETPVLLVPPMKISPSAEAARPAVLRLAAARNGGRKSAARGAALARDRRQR